MWSLGDMFELLLKSLPKLYLGFSLGELCLSLSLRGLWWLLSEGLCPLFRMTVSAPFRGPVRSSLRSTVSSLLRGTATDFLKETVTSLRGTVASPLRGTATSPLRGPVVARLRGTILATSRRIPWGYFPTEAVVISFLVCGFFFKVTV